MSTTTHTTTCGHKVVGTLTEHGDARIVTPQGHAATLPELVEHMTRLGCPIPHECATEVAWKIETELLPAEDDWTEALAMHGAA